MRAQVTALPGPSRVKVRLLGPENLVGEVADALASLNGCQVRDRSQPRPNQYEPGVRLYLTLEASHGCDQPLRPNPGDALVCPAGQVITGAEYRMTADPRLMHGNIACTHPGQVSIRRASGTGAPKDGTP